MMMMESGSASLTMSTMAPNVISSSPSGGRFDFDDGGTYCGGWQDGKAHGHGVCTGPKNVGEYSGSWNFGFEMSGVYKWTNGAVYEGRWQNGKRHGVGVEYNGKWIYKGEWSQGLKGRYGVKASSNSAVKYEGTWANGLQDGYGSETYSDGGYYQGQMCRGLRHGYGVRKSAPYGDSQLNNPSRNGPLSGTLLHANSIQSTGSASELQAAGARATSPLGVANGDGDDDSPKPEDGFKPNIDRTLVSKNGFVLVSKPLDVPLPAKMIGGSSGSGAGEGHSSGGKRRNSLTNRLAQTARLPNQTTASILRGLRLKKQKSTSDLDAILGSGSGAKHGARGGPQSDDSSPIIPFTLSPEELDITDPTTVETYMGEWKHDKRNGHGVCERSDGLKYEGQWHNDMKCGYGVTTFKDGTKEEGKYKNNILVVDSKVKRFFQLGGSNIRQRIDEATKMANQALGMALKKAEIANNRAATARDKADQAMTAAIEADRDSQIAYSVARQYSDSSLMQQQQMMLFGHQNFLGDQFGAGQKNNFAPTSLNMGASPLQMRRISQNQQRQSMVRGQQQQPLPPNSLQEPQLNHGGLGGEADQMQPSEPFNGRRGSFRGASQRSSGGSSYQRQTSIRHQQQQLGPTACSQQRNAHLQHHHHPPAGPFSDMFDHYESGGGGIASSLRNGSGGRRGHLSKQTSLDYAQLRGTSVPRQLGGPSFNNSTANPSLSAGQLRQRLRVSSSVDQTTGSGDGADAFEYNAQQQEFDEGHAASMQQQLRHLVTSGERLQQQHNQQDNSETVMNQQQHHQQQFNSGQTPTNSSYILQQSSAAGSVSTTFNGSPAAANHQHLMRPTPSPSTPPDAYAYQPPPNQQQSVYREEREAANYYGQRDVHSLADEQLYMADYRRRRAPTVRRNEPLGRTEYENYDFTITNGPRPTQRCRRRTASLTRASSLTPPAVGAGTGVLSMAADLVRPPTGRTPLGSTAHLARQNLGNKRLQASGLPSFNLSAAIERQEPRVNSINSNLNPLSLSPNSGFGGGEATSSCNSSAGGLSRKPSLQVRYDPNELGGLMSREEVAALSHAQREQKRFEAEMAEKRAKQPLLHLYLSLKEFVECHKLIISVIMVNLCLIRMLANLIA